MVKSVSYFCLTPKAREGHVLRQVRSALPDAMAFLVAAAVTLALVLTYAEPVEAKGGAKKPEKYDWSFNGIFGRYDPEALQRGYQVYRDVCSQCHSMDLLAFRHLGQRGAPFYNADYPNPVTSPYIIQLAADFGDRVRGVRTLSGGAEFEVIDGVGDWIRRAPVPSDYIPAPYDAATIQDMMDNGVAIPPDFSTIVKARKGGADYVHSLNLGYIDPPEGLNVPSGKYYNQYYPGDLAEFWDGDPEHVPRGGFISMAPALIEGAVTYGDGSVPTVEQMSSDVAHFLTWVSHPHMDARKDLGRQVIIYLTLLAVLLWFSYKQIWKNVKKG